FTQRMPQIATVEPASIAANAGIKEGDRILAINGFPTHSWQEVGMRLIEFFGKSKVILDVENKNEQRVLLLNLNQWHFKKGKANLLSSLGLSADKSDATKEAVPGRNLIKASYLALHKINDLLHFYLIMLKQIITAKIPFFVLLGPLGLFAVSANSFMQGLAVFLSFIASFSIAVGLVNLFPIPGLDGGLIVYALLEKIRKKPISVAMEILLHQLVSILAVILLIQLVLNDLTRGIN
ncbi:MAG: RIP metalloprotease, partial [Proteobacteria bacterium]|nr:RIP metalloprotease [Pseudomonadota bacterium]